MKNVLTLFLEGPWSQCGLKTKGSVIVGFLATPLIIMSLPNDAKEMDSAQNNESISLISQASASTPRPKYTVPDNYKAQKFETKSYGDISVAVSFPACPNKLFIDQGADDKIIPASITKALLLMLAAETIDDPAYDLSLEDEIKVPQIAITESAGLARFYKTLKSGDTHSLARYLSATGARSEAISTITVAIAIADARGYQGSDKQKLTQVIEQMNVLAQKANMTNSTFINVTGSYIDFKTRNHGNFSTARDLTKLLNYFQAHHRPLFELTLGRTDIYWDNLTDRDGVSSRYLEKYSKSALNQHPDRKNEPKALGAKTGALRAYNPNGGSHPNTIFNELIAVEKNGSRANIALIGSKSKKSREEAITHLAGLVNVTDVRKFCASPS